MKTCALLLAKRNSRRLPDKNVLDFNGKPMWMINTEKCLEIFDRVFVTTDDMEIFFQAYQMGAHPIQRPPVLCGNCPNIPVYQYCKEYMVGYDGLVAVQVNSPSIDPFTIATVKRIIEEGEFQEVMTCHENKKIYGSVWALTFKKLDHYEDAYHPKPDVTVVDPSVDIHSWTDYRKALNQNLIPDHPRWIVSF